MNPATMAAKKRCTWKTLIKKDVSPAPPRTFKAVKVVVVGATARDEAVWDLNRWTRLSCVRTGTNEWWRCGTNLMADPREKRPTNKSRPRRKNADLTMVIWWGIIKGKIQVLQSIAQLLFVVVGVGRYDNGHPPLHTVSDVTTIVIDPTKRDVCDGCCVLDDVGRSFGLWHFGSISNQYDYSIYSDCKKLCV